MADIKRVTKVVDWLIFEKIVKSRKDLALKMGYTESSMSQILNQKVPLSEKFIKNLSILDNRINIDWLLGNEGDMLKEGKGYMEIGESGTSPILNEYQENYNTKGRLETIPLVEDIKATCGTPDGFSVAIKKDDCTPIIIPGLNGEFAIRAKGRSMINRKNPEKSINENNIIVCNRWTSRSYIRWGEVYALATNDGVVVKQVVPSEQEGYVRCVSFNEEEGYKAFELPVLEISDWAIVVGVVNIALFA